MIQQKRLVNTFINLVKIDSPSGHEQEISAYLKDKLNELGGKAITDDYGNIIGKFAGVGRPIILNAHMDTVEPGKGVKPKMKGDKIVSDGTTVLGGDDKAGIAIILEVLASLKDEIITHRPIEVIFTRQEESNLLGAKNLDYSKITAGSGLTFDGEAGVERIDIASPSYIKVDILIHGRSAHAGLEPEKGISAIQISGHIISRLKLGRIDSETTCNIGLISGGTVRNAVPDFVHIKGEIRSRNPESLKKHISHFKEVLEKIQSKYPEAKIESEIVKEIEGYLLTENHHMILHVSRILKQMNLKPIYHHSGGLTAINIFHSHNIEIINIGTGDYLPHTKQEYVVISQMLQAAEFCEKAVTV